MSSAIPDPELRVIRRERRASRLAGVVALASSTVGFVGWGFGPCLYVFTYPYIWRGRPLLFLWAALIGYGAAGLLVAAARIRRARRENPAALTAAMRRVVFLSAVAGAPALCGWPYLLRFAFQGPGFAGFGAWAAVGTALASIPLVPGLLALVVWLKYGRVFPTLTATGADAPRSRHGRLAIAFAALALCVVWPGGPRSAGSDAEHEGVPLDEWVRRWVSGDPEARRVVDAIGEPAGPSVAAQLPHGARGLRVHVAQWLGSSFNLADHIAPMFLLFRMGAISESEIVHRLRNYPNEAATTAPAIARWAQGRKRSDRSAALWTLRELGPPAAPGLIVLAAGDAARILPADLADALDAISRVWKKGAQPLPAATLAPLLPLLEHSDPKVQVMSARAYGAWTEPTGAERVLPILRRHLRSSDSKLRRSAAWSATWIRVDAKPLTPDLISMARQAIATGDLQGAEAAMFSMVSIGDDRAGVLALLRSALAHGGHALHRSAAHAASYLKEKAVPLRADLEPLLSDTMGTCRRTAITSIIWIEDDASSVLQAIDAELGARRAAGGIDSSLPELLGALGASARAAIPVLERHVNDDFCQEPLRKALRAALAKIQNADR